MLPEPFATNKFLGLLLPLPLGTLLRAACMYFAIIYNLQRRFYKGSTRQSLAIILDS